VSDLLFAVLAGLRVFFRSRLDTSLEILALRHQVAVLRRKRRRVRLTRIDRLFWVALRSSWSRWSEALLVVKPATVIAWHRAGFRLYWRWRSRSGGGRPRINDEIRTLIRQMRSENSGWGAPKIHGELLKLGFQVSERTVGRYLRRLHPGHRGNAQNWFAFLSNHREVLVAFGRVEDWRHCPVGSAYPLLPVSVGSASVSEP
jgi:putative transposase